MHLSRRLGRIAVFSLTLNTVWLFLPGWQDRSPGFVIGRLQAKWWDWNAQPELMWSLWWLDSVNFPFPTFSRANGGDTYEARNLRFIALKIEFHVLKDDERNLNKWWSAIRIHLATWPWHATTLLSHVLLHQSLRFQTCHLDLWLESERNWISAYKLDQDDQVSMYQGLR